MKKIFLGIICLLLVVGCTWSSKNTAKYKVEEYLMKYQKNDDEIIKELDTEIKKEDYSESQKKTYKEILLKQYTDLKYEIIEEVVNADEATVTAEISVYDLYKVQKNTATYLSTHKEEFNDNTGVYSKEKYLDYKLSEMKKAIDKVTYTLTFTLKKEDNSWKVTNLDNTILEKIHGIYNYEQS